MVVMENEKILFIGATVVPISAPAFEDGALLIEGSKILDIGTSQELLSKYPTLHAKDYAHTIILPGLINPHVELESSLFMSQEALALDCKSDVLDFVPWLMSLSQDKTAKSQEYQKEAIKHGLEKMIQLGYTCIGDLSSNSTQASLYEESGLRIVAFAELFPLNNESVHISFEKALDRLETLSENPSEKISTGIAPFSAYTLSKNYLKILYSHAEQLKIPVHLHCASSFAEMEFFFSSSGDISEKLFPFLSWTDLPPPHQMTPIQYLREISFLSERTSLIDCYHLGGTDLGILEQASCNILYSTQSAQKLKIGSLPYQSLLKSEVNWALYSPGPYWQSDFSPWSEIKQLKKDLAVEKIEILDNDILKKVTLDAARCLGKEDEIGSLEIGKKADLLILKKPNSMQTLPWLSLEAGPQDILETWVNGKKLLSNV